MKKKIKHFIANFIKTKIDNNKNNRYQYLIKIDDNLLSI